MTTSGTKRSDEESPKKVKSSAPATDLQEKETSKDSVAGKANDEDKLKKDDKAGRDDATNKDDKDDDKKGGDFMQHMSLLDAFFCEK